MNCLTRDQIATRVAKDVPEGTYVNLGIGLPTSVASHLPHERDIFLHSLVHSRSGSLSWNTAGRGPCH